MSYAGHVIDPEEGGEAGGLLRYIQKPCYPERLRGSTLASPQRRWRGGGGRLGNPRGEERVEGGGQESCHPALTSPLNFKVALASGMLGRGGDLAPTLLLSAVVLRPQPCWREEGGG